MNGANRENGDAQGLPSVYHPIADTDLPYDEYADPAVAHGWQNAYDDTVRLDPAEPMAGPAVASAVGPAVEPRRDSVPALPEGVGRRDRLMRRRRTRLMRRGAVAAGAAGVVLLAVVIAGLFGSDSSGSSGEGDRKGPKAQHSSSSADRQGAAGSSDDSSGPSGTSPGKSDQASPDASASPSPSESRPGGSGDSGEPATKAPTTTAPATTGEPSRGNGGDNPGRGQGSTKGPK
ncbi:hypothetical protein [Streptomyces albicerus]|uniref:hypothetical protein n=1 Tax=Streptomyces albicerus TaxID=2569859 RepID=UPI00124BB27B|nr:hypothetical protein [Streptomyces albicerus]